VSSSCFLIHGLVCTKTCMYSRVRYVTKIFWVGKVIFKAMLLGSCELELCCEKIFNTKKANWHLVTTETTIADKLTQTTRINFFKFVGCINDE
jgi:hypothetical protein